MLGGVSIICLLLGMLFLTFSINILTQNIFLLSPPTQPVLDGSGFGFPVTVFADKANTASRAR